MKKILVTGGGGYVGTVLIDSLLNDGNQVTVVDTFWFGNFLKKNKNLEIVKEDIRNLSIEKIKSHNTIIHLANIANDPTVAMDPELSWNVNVLGTHSLIDKASRAGVEHFIFGSSGSVYGIKDEPDVVEDMILVPISTYAFFVRATILIASVLCANASDFWEPEFVVLIKAESTGLRRVIIPESSFINYL